MLYNKIGKTDRKASILGLGCMRLPMLEVKDPPRDFFERQKAVDEEASLEMIDYYHALVDKYRSPRSHMIATITALLTC